MPNSKQANNGMSVNFYMPRLQITPNHFKSLEGYKYLFTKKILHYLSKRCIRRSYGLSYLFGKGFLYLFFFFDTMP